jgi:hypothetical protein
MCTLVVGRDVLGPGSLLLATNRDEDPARPSDPPGILLFDPRVVGGRDRVAGGTWLAIREGRAAVALLNRRDRRGEPSAPIPGRRSRGLLTLDVAAARDVPDAIPSRWNALVGSPLARAALGTALLALGETSYAPFSLTFLSPESCWLLAFESGQVRCGPIGPGWHVLTHADLDDRSEPRTAWLSGQLSDWSPTTVEEAIARLTGWMRGHGGSRAEGGTEPPVCLHQGRMVTVSSNIVVWTREGVRYRHADGRPCEHDYVDHTSLLAGEGERHVRANATPPDAPAQRAG